MTVPLPRALLSIALPLTIVLLSAACGSEAPEAVETETVVPVTTSPAVRGTIRGLVRATGVVAPAPGAELVVIAPEPARITEIPRADGERVRQGDVLVRFEIPAATAEVERQQAEVTRAQAALSSAQAAETRARDLFDRGIAARREVEEAGRAEADARAAVAQARASLAAAEAAAGRAVVRATFDGVIVKRLHNPGDLVEPAAADAVLRVVDLGRLEVVASVPLADTARVTIGAPARLAGTDGAALSVVSLPAAVEPGSSTVAVRLASRRPLTLPVGAPVQVEIDAERRRDVVLVPAAALVREGDETAVFVAAGTKAVRHVVEPGLSDGTHVEIVSGISAGDAVIVDGQAGLPDGTTIAPGKAGDAGAAGGGRDASR